MAIGASLATPTIRAIALEADIKEVKILNIFLFSFILFNLFDGDRGFFSFLDKKKQKEILLEQKKGLTKELNSIEHKNDLLSEKLNYDYLDILIRQKLKLGNSNEVIIRLNE